jgi:ABC-type transport system involved in multi-copper enzyme maturation permease subunit
VTAGALEAGLYRAFRFNPCVVRHELRLHMRGWRPFIVLLAYAAIASAAVLLTFLPALLDDMGSPYGEELGRTALTALAFTQLTLILLLLPTYAAAAISMEREKRTLDMLRATLVTPKDVVTGKLLVVFAFGVVLLLTSLPVAAWCLLLGGVSPEEILYTYTYLLAAAALVSALGLAFSARVARPMGAVVSTYGALILLGVLSVVTPSLIMFVGMSRSGAPSLTTFGRAGALAITAVVGLFAGLLVLRLCHAALARALGQGRAVLSWLLAVLATAALAFALRQPWSAAATAIENAYLTWMMIANPYIVLCGILIDEFGSAFSGGMGPAPAGAGSIQFLSWSLGLAINLFLALLLWAQAIRSFARRT